MSKRRSAQAGPVAITILLLLEGLYFFWFGNGLMRLFRGARNASAADSLPPAVWTNFLSAVLCVVVAAAYFADFRNFRRWSVPLAVAALLYGVWGIWSGYSLVSSLSSAFSGDVVAVGVLSGAGFAAIGLLGLLCRPV